MIHPKRIRSHACISATLSILALFCTVLLPAGTATADTIANDPELKQIHVSVDNPHMKPGENQTLRFRAELTDGSQLTLSDLTREQTRLLSLNPTVATVGSAGQIYARNTGAATIQVDVSIGGSTQTAHVRIGVPERTLHEQDFVLDGEFGSYGSTIEQIGENHFVFTRGHHPEEESRRNLPQFMIPENFKGNSLIVDITPLGLPHETHHYHMAYSLDGENWTPILQTLADENVARIEIPPTNSDSFYLGFQIPFSYDYSRELIREWTTDPATSEYITLHPIGRSLQGRPLYRMEITDPESPHRREDRWVHYISQAHPHEGKSRWRVKGMLDWLLSDDPEAADARQRHIWHFVLTMNPDGVNNGFTRHNMQGRDMNRTYRTTGPDSTVQAHEGYLFQKDIAQLIESDTPITTFWDMHVWGGRVEPMMLAGPEMGSGPGQVGEFAELRDLIESYDRDDLIIPLAERNYDGDASLWDRGVHHHYGITTAIVEGSGFLDTQEENLKAGRILIRSINEFYRETRADFRD